MGMTADFEVAVEEGATLIRIGTALFGPRPDRRPSRGGPGDHRGGPPEDRGGGP
jgi:PLP dependent protein